MGLTNYNVMLDVSENAIVHAMFSLSLSLSNSLFLSLSLPFSPFLSFSLPFSPFLSLSPPEFMAILMWKIMKNHDSHLICWVFP